MRLTVVVALFLGASSAVSADSDSASFFAELRKAYADKSAYADVGELEITETTDGIEGSVLHYFETSGTRGAGLIWRVLLASDRGGFEDRVVWLSGDSVMSYDSGLQQTKQASSFSEAIQEILGHVAARALVVPDLLDFGTPSQTLEALAADASLTEEEPCLEDRRCRRLSVSLPDTTKLALWVDADSFWVHDVTVTSTSGDTITTIRVRHSESPLDEDLREARATFSPPPSALEVDEWEDTTAESVDPLNPAQGFFEIITVNLFTTTARVVDRSGDPIPNLQPGDLVATIGDHEFPIVAVDWEGPPLPSAETGAAPDETTKEPLAALERDGGPVAQAAGRQIVIFLQNDFEPSRIKGQMKLFPDLRRMVDDLGPKDRVAVLSFFAHLKLWQDFTTDKASVQASLGRAFFPGAKPGVVAQSSPPSLLDTFQPAAAREIASSIEALRYTADALAAIPGEKDILFFGYGLQGKNAGRMFRALQAARATTFVLDTTQADYHTLGAGLMSMAEVTGGTYASSYNFVSLAMKKIERLITGRYRITIDRSRRPDALGKLRIRLKDKTGTVLMTPSGFS